MATVKDNIIISGLSGKLSELVFKQYKNKVVVSKRPDMSNVPCSAKQRMNRNRFAEAIQRVRQALDNPEQNKLLQDRFAAKAKRKGSTVYHLALREYLTTR